MSVNQINWENNEFWNSVILVGKDFKITQTSFAHNPESSLKIKIGIKVLVAYYYQ